LRIAFDIILSVNDWLQIAGILVANMTLVGSRMNGNALTSELLYVIGNFQKVVNAATASISQSGYFVDVYA